MQSSTIHRSGNHIDKRSRMIVVVALFGNLLFSEIRVERTRLPGGSGGYMNVLSRSHGSSRNWRRPLITHSSRGRCRGVAGGPKSPEWGKGAHEEVTELIIRGNKIKGAIMIMEIVCRNQNA